MSYAPARAPTLADETEADVLEKPMPAPMMTKHAEVPEGVRVYAIGDIHGRADLLDPLLERIDADAEAFPVARRIEVFVGDYVDRGPASPAVLDRLIARSRTHEIVFLKGNHEAYFLEFLKDPAVLSEWQRYGALETLVSYNLTPSLNADAREQARLSAALKRALPDSHRRFLANLKVSFTCGDFFFAHAGVRPGIPLARQREEDLLWIREDFLLSEADFTKIVVHGHTPVLKPEVHMNRINIDTGAYATNRLTCLVLDRDEMLFI
jgi:serine/threonine protein phosphatase 1